MGFSTFYTFHKPYKTIIESPRKVVDEDAEIQKNSHEGGACTFKYLINCLQLLPVVGNIGVKFCNPVLIFVSNG